MLHANHLLFPAKLSLILVTMLLSCMSLTLSASDSVLFLEGQMVGAYDSATDEAILYSHHVHDSMQKPSLGFDLVKRFSNESRDWGILAVQYRVAYQKDIKPRFASQLFNAYYKQKLPMFDLWIGSNKPALGLSSTLDNHAALLSDMSMKVFTFDRDWGIGMDKDLNSYKLSFSATNGSGQKIYNKQGNYLLAGRFGVGNYNKSNFNIGLSAAHGKVLEAMGYTLGHPNSSDGEYILHNMDYLGLDGSYRYLNMDIKADALWGEFYHKPARAYLLRAGLNMLDEDKLVVEAQALHSKYVVFESINLSIATSYKLNADFTIRAMADYNIDTDEYKLVGQLYFYKPFGL